MLELVDRQRLQQSPIEYQIRRLKKLAIGSFARLTAHQTPEGDIPASIGRCDDENFGKTDEHGNVYGFIWVKDAARAVQHTLDPLVQRFLPEIYDPHFIQDCQLKKTAPEFYLSGIKRLLNLQTQPDQLRRFESRPHGPDIDGYKRLDEGEAAAIKFNPDGSLNPNWGHNQPDNWGTLLLEAGKGIEQGWPLLETPRAEPFPPGLILGKITAYIARLGVERLICRSIWEHSECWSSYSTRRIVHGGLEQMYKPEVWKELKDNSRKAGYKLPISRTELGDGLGRLEDKIKEHFPADYTDSHEHEHFGDLAMLVVLNDLNLPADEQIEIRNRTAELENRYGFYRYFGDHWKKGRAETKWTMGKPIVACHDFLQSIELYEKHQPIAAFRALDHGWDRISAVMEIDNTLGYIPELFEEKYGIYGPNNNELAWTRSYTIEAAAAGMAAVTTSDNYYNR